VRLYELLNLEPGELIVGLKGIVKPYASYATINLNGWDDSFETVPPIFFVENEFLQNCFNQNEKLKITTIKDLTGQHLLDNCLAMHVNNIYSILKYWQVPEIKKDGCIGMSLGRTLCLYEHPPSIDEYNNATNLIRLKIYHQMIFRHSIYWMQLSLEAFMYKQNTFNEDLLSVIISEDVKIK
jgi:hypothetical protein